MTVFSVVQKASMSEEEVPTMYEYTRFDMLLGDATMSSTSVTTFSSWVFDSKARSSVSVQVLDEAESARRTE
ncbi:uncharacterized protein IUM83_17130 [Phytophthora cinnamomi]|uniref:uncharacterized protein n=1 Tax=Phytophthora cinnamomi TaxID=4785 RepID=UPI00355A9464|nr:hypothetical protein IUM83_13395 [Phytophthora cinnamomi]KAG6613297.1 hypothetical protein IUM83_17130 [Phytophthora cinnamomi]